MKKNGFAPLIIILIIAILGVVGYFGYKNYSKRSLVVSTPNTTISTIGTYSLSSYKSNDIKLSFSYPSDWGNAMSDSGKQNHGEYIRFENNKNIFSVAGDFGRGSIVNGVELKTYEKTDMLTSDKHPAEVIIYTDPESKYWIEGTVSGKNVETAEPFYIKFNNGLDQKTVLDYKEQFIQLMSSLKFNQ